MCSSRFTPEHSHATIVAKRGCRLRRGSEARCGRPTGAGTQSRRSLFQSRFGSHRLPDHQVHLLIWSRRRLQRPQTHSGCTAGRGLCRPQQWQRIVLEDTSHSRWQQHSGDSAFGHCFTCPNVGPPASPSLLPDLLRVRHLVICRHLVDCHCDRFSSRPKFLIPCRERDSKTETCNYGVKTPTWTLL